MNMEIRYVLLCAMCLITAIKAAAPCSHERDSEKIGLYSKEIHFTNDQRFWAPDTSHHYTASETVDTSKQYVMHLRNVGLTTGPTYPSGSQTEALYFSASGSSYATVVNNRTNSTVADEYFTWYMRILPDDPITGSGVILEYSDCENPLRIEQVNDSLTVTVGDNLLQLHNISAPGIFGTSWTTLAVTYKVNEVYFKIIQFLDPDPVETLLPICEVDIQRRINATGDVRIGASYDWNMPAFAGKISCLQFFQGYFLKQYETVPDYCDPALARHATLGYQDVTQDEDPNNLLPWRLCPGDEFTTESPTTESPTTELPTTESPTTESPTTESPTTEPPTTESPTTELPTTESPTTELPTTESPTTESPTTESPTTELPTTESPTTESPTTESPTTESSTTESPTTQLPTTESPTTESPTTESLTTVSPTTELLIIESPTTESPTTESPTTESSTTESPTTESPTTESPTTESPTIEAPTIQSLGFQPQYGCATYRRVSSKAEFATVGSLITSLTTGTTGFCAQICFRTSGCMAFGYDTVMCHLGNDTEWIPNSATGFEVFVME